MARAYPGARPHLLDEVAAILRRARRRLRQRRYRLSARPRMIGGGLADATMLGGSRLFLDPADRGLSQSLMANGYWEMWLTEALSKAVKPGMVAIDIGANVGYFSVLMAERVGRQGKVHAFEPNPQLAALLFASATRAGLGDRVVVHREPLWDSDGQPSLLKIPDGEPKNAHLVINAGEDQRGVRLLTRRLDSYTDLLDADVIKIDVEGAEQHVWRGMAGLFARRRPLTIFLEFSPVRYSSPTFFLNEILARGFQLNELSVSHGCRAVTPEQVLAGDPREDRMLAIIRGVQA